MRLGEQDLDGDEGHDEPASLLPDAARAHTRRLTVREIVVLSWAGTRGVISLAAIFTLPADHRRAGTSPTATCCCSARSSWCW